MEEGGDAEGAEEREGGGGGGFDMTGRGVL